jgi:hypothetical protein
MVFTCADLSSKLWSYQQIWKMLQPLLYYQGDTAELFDKEATFRVDGE